MMKHRDDLTAEYVRELLDYNPETGVLIWKRGTRRAPKGRIAGCPRPDGRLSLGIDGHIYLAYRIIWLIQTGHFPVNQIDHIDGDPSNNRWDNLRAATQSQNNSNMRTNKVNKSGFNGVSFYKRTGRYVAFIQKNRKTEYLGYFDTAEEAHEAYCARAKELHGEFHNPG